MKIPQEPQLVSPVNNPLDYVQSFPNFTSIISEVVVRDNNFSPNDTSAQRVAKLTPIDTNTTIKRLNIYGDDTTRFNNSDIVKNTFKRIDINDTFLENIYNPFERFKIYFQLTDVNSPTPPIIMDWKYVFNGKFDRNEFLKYDFNKLLNIPLMSKYQMFFPEEKGRFEIFNGQYNESVKNDWEYINFETDVNSNEGNVLSNYDTDINSVQTTSSIQINDGYLYNWNLCNTFIDGKNVIINNNQPNGTTGWRMPSREDWFNLRDVADPLSPSGISGNNNNNASLKLKTIGNWASGTSTNDYGFSILPAGFLFNPEGIDATYLNGSTGSPSTANTEARFMTSTEVDDDDDNHWYVLIQASNNRLNVFGENQKNKRFGYSVRLCRPALPNELDYNPSGYTGNDGIVYPTVKIGNLVWLATNLQETRWDVSIPIPFKNNFVGSLAGWDHNPTYAFTYYSSDSISSFCLDALNYTYPCITSTGNRIIVRPATQSLTYISVLPNPINKKIYRFQNLCYERYENHQVALFRSYQWDTSNNQYRQSNLITTITEPNTLSKQVSVPCYPKSFQNLKGRILNKTPLTIEMENIPNDFQIPTGVAFIKFKDMDTNNANKRLIVGSTYNVSSINGNTITFIQAFNTSGWNDDYECMVLVGQSMPLFKPKLTIIPCTLGSTNFNISGVIKRVLTLTFPTTFFNNLTSSTFIQLSSTNSSLLSLFGDIKIMTQARTSGNAINVTIRTRKVVSDDLLAWITANGSNPVNFISFDSFAYDDFEYNESYKMYSSEMLETPVGDTSLYQKVFHEPIEFNKFKCIKGGYEPIQIGYYNSLGAKEYVLFNKRNDTRDFDRLSMRKPLEVGVRNPWDEELYNYNTTVEYKTTLTTDWLEEEVYQRYLDLVESNRVFEVDYINQTEVPIVIMNNSVVERNNRNDKLFIFSLEYVKTYNKNIQE